MGDYSDIRSGNEALSGGAARTRSLDRIWWTRFDRTLDEASTLGRRAISRHNMEEGQCVTKI
jgi:hypothetical protein